MLTIKRLSLTEAKVLIQGATQKSLEMNIPMCMAHLDLLTTWISNT